METQEKSNNFKKLILKGINKAQQEIEELAVQFSLGKAEASDKFEEIKKEFSKKSFEWKLKISEIKNDEKYANLKAMLEELELQLALGKAEAIELFEEQRKAIVNAVNALQEEVKRNPEWKANMNEFDVETEKFKLKLEIMKLKFELKGFELNEDIKEGMLEARKKIDHIFKGVEDRWDASKNKYADFEDEILLAYKHLKKAVKGL